MKKRQDATVLGAATNVNVLLKLLQNLAKDRFDCLFDGNMRMPLLLVFNSQTVFMLKPVFANTCHQRAAIARTQRDVSSVITHHSTKFTPWSTANPN